MGRITVYLDDETEKLVRRNVQRSGESASRWIAEAVRRRVSREWPPDVHALFGSWKDEDFPDTGDLRKGHGKDVKRAALQVFALDANTLICVLKGLGRVQDLMEALDPVDLAVPAIVAYEIENGTLSVRQMVRDNPPAGKPEARRDVHRLFSALTILPFDARGAEHAARLRHLLERNGEKIGPTDTLIAGTAPAFGPILVTRNTREFSRVPGLRVEDRF